MLPFLQGHGDQPFSCQVSLITPGHLTGELSQIFPHTGDVVNMGLFNIKIQGPGHGIGSIGNGLKCRLHTVNKSALDLIGILVQKRIPQNP